MRIQRLISFLLFGLLAFAGTTRWQNLSEDPLIMTDGQGYYAYLPATFLYHDLQFHFVDQINGTYYAEDKRANYVVEGENGNVNKYFAGTAVIQTPFFLVACAISRALELPIDGYSWPFQLMVGIAAIVGLSLGLLLLGMLLMDMGFSEKTSILTLLIITFGTNLFYYSVYEPSMSHVYSFFTVSAFLYFGRKSLTEQKTFQILAASAALGLTVLIRPVNGLVLLGIPAVSGGLLSTVMGIETLFRQKGKMLFGAALLAIAIMAVQPMIYILQTGKPFVWSYQKEGFNFLHPEVINVLFSFRKGLFVYCPALLLAMGGIFIGVSKRKLGFAELLLFLALITWVISSWWMWYYGGSFGHRAFIEYYPFFAIGFAFALRHGLGVIGPKSVLAIGVTLIAIQLLQTYQYNKHIITFDNMNETKYWNLFLRTGDDLAWYYSGYEGQDSYTGKDSIVIRNNMEAALGWGNEQQLTDEKPYAGTRSAHMSCSDQYGPTFRRSANEMNVDLIRISAWVWSDSRITDLAFVCAIEDSTGSSYFWNKRPLRPQFNGTGNWTQVTALFRCGQPRNNLDTFVFYPMKSDCAEVYLDDLEISFVTEK